MFPVSKKTENAVLIAVVKNKRDLNFILKDHWYRIPLKHAPKKEFSYLAFYGPDSGKLGKKISYYAKIKTIETKYRYNILPRELSHPRVNEKYLYIELNKIYKLPKPIRNISRRRVTFAFTTLPKLKKAKTILELYEIPPIEEMFEKALKKSGIKYKREFTTTIKGKKFRLDFAILGKSHKIAIECDNKKAHSLALQKVKDKIKDNLLKSSGWRVLRFTENEIVNNTDKCILQLQNYLR